MEILKEMEELGWEYIETYLGGYYRKGGILNTHIENGEEWTKDIASLVKKD